MKHYNNSIKYRADIDGLRAIAVLSVMFFHSGISFVSGGYVGVDVFFVISGYLITKIIVGELQDGSFSIARFYERRFRRILPALVVVIVTSLIVGSLLFSPRGVVDLGQSAIATALFSSNILFFLEAGYFDTAAEMKPLLHTWSLAIEEQYYIIFPLFLIFIKKFLRGKYFLWIAVIAVLSLCCSVVLTEKNSSAAFYLIPSRAWELFIGSILAVKKMPAFRNKYVIEIVSIIGFILICYSVFNFNSNTKFPGIVAVLPTLGTALIIYAGSAKKTIISAILSARPVVFVGLISYSLYLWHWPVIVFSKIYYVKDIHLYQQIFNILLIFLASVFSWKYVEMPLRQKKILMRRKPLLITSFSTIILLICIGSVCVVQQRFPRRVTNHAMVSPINDPIWDYSKECEGVIRKITSGNELCDLGDEKAQASFIVWGDSHARAMVPAIDVSASKYGFKGKIATKSACPPLMSIERPGRTTCNEFNQNVLEYISSRPDIETVILAARWALSTKGTRYKSESGKDVNLIDLASEVTIRNHRAMLSYLISA